VIAAQTTLDPAQMKDWTPNSRYGGHAFGFMNSPQERDAQFAEFLTGREKLLPWINEYSPYALVTADDPPVYLFYRSPPNMGQPEKDPTHTANFGVKLAERMAEAGVGRELVYPGAPGVLHATVQDYRIGVLRPSKTPVAGHPEQRRPQPCLPDQLRPQWRAGRQGGRLLGPVIAKEAVEGPWKIVVDEQLKKPELYDIASDLAETTNLAAREPERLSAMMRRLAAYRAEVAAEGPTWPAAKQQRPPKPGPAGPAVAPPSHSP